MGIKKQSIDLNIEKLKDDDDFGDMAHRFFELNPSIDEFDTRPARLAWASALREEVEEDSFIDFLLCAHGTSAAYAIREIIAKRIGCKSSLILEIQEKQGIHFINAAKELILRLSKRIADEETKMQSDESA